MSTLSRYLMVTGGNVTALTDELEREGLVQRDSDPDDRRSWRLRMTAAGRKAFERIAREHEQWVIELFAGLDIAAKAIVVRRARPPARADGGQPGESGMSRRAAPKANSAVRSTEVVQ